MPYEEGDQTKLLSGGPLMTVTRVDGDRIYCRWFTPGGELHDGAFSEGTLELAGSAADQKTEV